jgi:hypothetical protein
MTDAQKLMERAYSNLSKLTVSGEAIILVACVMQDLKDAYNLTKEPDEGEVKADG